MFRILFNTSKRGLCAGSCHLKSLPVGYAVKSSSPVANQLFSVPFRNYSSEENKASSGATLKRRMLPPLMSFEEVIWPSIFKSIRSFIFVHFIIRPYLDDEFVVKEFTLGAKQAVHVISEKLASGDWDGLRGLVSDDIVPELKENLAKMNVSQRSLVNIAPDDIYLTFPYQIGIIFEDDDPLKRIVEITMIFHTIKGLQDILNRGEQIPMNLNNAPEHRDRITICNYRFRRTYNKGEPSGPWIVNLLNQFKPADLLLENE